jgi:ABC-type Fe3+-hydroxamate transport system substrate-binding protein
MPFFRDQLQREVIIRDHPQRIVSLVPSQTELLYDLGLQQEVIGVTKFCIHPQPWATSKARIGGTKNLDLNKIKNLRPDLIIANKEENKKEQVETLAKDFPVWISDVFDLKSALAMIEQVGSITSRVNESIKLSQDIRKGFEGLGQKPFLPIRVLYLIWSEPYMGVGGDTFIHDMLRHAGFDNELKNESRYPIINVRDLVATDCELILLSSEPYPFRQKDVLLMEQLFINKVRIPKIRLVDGAIFSWYGSRLLKAPSYFGHLRDSI